MPELPEVETVVRTLEHQLGNQTIKSVNVIYPRIIDNISIDEFEKKLVGQKFEQYSRRGKYLLFTLTDYILVAHLRMEGKFYIYPHSTEITKHTHVVFELDNCELHYNDVRKFGRFYLYEKNEEIKCVSSLGLEPFDENLTSEYCREHCKNIHIPIKSKLLDQSLIAGIGNIYADEICGASQLNPFTPSCFISKEKWDKIIVATKDILKNAIAAGGTTIRSYTSSLGVTGLFQMSLRVHSRENLCDTCHTQIIKTKIGSRGTYYCPSCQKRKPVVVCITGTMGSGKSTVTKIIESMGYLTISCDEINRGLLNQQNTINDLANIFACDPSIVDKSYISKQIFHDLEMKHAVEDYLHSRIHQKIVEWEQENQDKEFLFVEVPLLFEVNWDYYSDYSVLVTSSEETVYNRLIKKRSMSKETIEERLAHQYSVDLKKSKADYIIENNFSIDELTTSVKKLLNLLHKINK